MHPLLALVQVARASDKTHLKRHPRLAYQIVLGPKIQALEHGRAEHDGNGDSHARQRPLLRCTESVGEAHNVSEDERCDERKAA